MRDDGWKVKKMTRFVALIATAEVTLLERNYEADGVGITSEHII